MATHLYRLGRWSFRHRLTVIATWLLLLVLGGAGALTLAGSTNDRFELPDTESARAFELIKERTGTNADGATAQLVVQAPDGEEISAPAAQEAIGSALAQVQTDHVVSLTDPFTVGAVSQDGTTAYAVVSYDRQSGELTDADRGALIDAAQALPRRRLPGVRRRRRPAGDPRPRRGRDHRRRGGPGRPGRDAGLAGGRRDAAAHRGHRRGDRDARHHHADRLRRPVVDHPGAGQHARPGGRHRLRAVHHVALQARGDGRPRPRGRRRASRPGPPARR